MAKTLVYRGPGPSRTYSRGSRQFTFHAGKPVVVGDDEFAAELLGQNPDRLTAKEAEPYGIPVFEEVGPGSAPAKGGGDEEEVGG